MLRWRPHNRYLFSCEQNWLTWTDAVVIFFVDVYIVEFDQRVDNTIVVMVDVVVVGHHMVVVQVGPFIQLFLAVFSQVLFDIFDDFNVVCSGARLQIVTR